MSIEQSHQKLRLVNEALQEMDAHVRTAVDGFGEVYAITHGVLTDLSGVGVVHTLLKDARAAYNEGTSAFNETIQPNIQAAFDHILEADIMAVHDSNIAVDEAAKAIDKFIAINDKIGEISVGLRDIIVEVPEKRSAAYNGVEEAYNATEFLVAERAFLVHLSVKNSLVQDKITTYLGNSGEEQK